MVRIEEHEEALKKLRQHSPNAFLPDGSLKTYQDQISHFRNFRERQFLVLAEESKEMSLVYGSSRPLVLLKGKVDLIQKIHPEVVPLIPHLPNLIRKSPLSIESKQNPKGIVLVLDPKNIPSYSDTNQQQSAVLLPIVIDRNVAQIQVDKISSLYEKEQFDKFLTSSYVAGKKMFLNKNFAEWSGKLPVSFRQVPDPPSLYYFNTGKYNSKGNLALFHVELERPGGYLSNGSIQRKNYDMRLKASTPEGFQWITNYGTLLNNNELEKLADFRLCNTNPNKVFDIDPVYLTMIKEASVEQARRDASSHYLPLSGQNWLSDHPDEQVRENLAFNRSINDTVSYRMRGDKSTKVRAALAMSAISKDVVYAEELFKDKNPYVVACVVINPACDKDILKKVQKTWKNNEYIQEAIKTNPNYVAMKRDELEAENESASLVEQLLYEQNDANQELGL
jgi:hypothetical protein